MDKSQSLFLCKRKSKTKKTKFTECPQLRALCGEYLGLKILSFALFLLVMETVNIPLSSTRCGQHEQDTIR
jgi:hypothetical protein